MRRPACRRSATVLRPTSSSRLPASSPRAGLISLVVLAELGAIATGLLTLVWICGATFRQLTDESSTVTRQIATNAACRPIYKAARPGDSDLLLLTGRNNDCWWFDCTIGSLRSAPELSSVMVTRVAGSPGTSALYAGLQSGAILQFGTDQSPSELPCPRRGPVESLAVSPDGETLAYTTGHKQLIVWDIAACCLKSVSRLTCERVTRLLFLPDGEHFAVAPSNGDVLLYRVGETRPRNCVLNSFGSPRSLACSPDSQRLFVASATGDLLCWNISDSTELWRASKGRGILTLLASRDGQTLYCGNTHGELVLYSTTDGEVTSRHSLHRLGVSNLMHDRTGEQVLTMGYSGEITRYNPNDGTARVLLPANPHPEDLPTDHNR